MRENSFCSHLPSDFVNKVFYDGFLLFCSKNQASTFLHFWVLEWGTRPTVNFSTKANGRLSTYKNRLVEQLKGALAVLNLT